MKTRYLTYFILVILLFDKKAWSDLQKDIQVRGILFPTSLSNSVNDQLGQVRLNLIYEKKWSQQLKSKIHLLEIADLSNLSIEEKNYLDFPEAYLKWRHSRWIFKVGTDIYNWGVTDGQNPVDLLNTKQYYDPLHSVKIGAPSLSASYSMNHVDADLVWIPQARPAQLPGTSSRWLPREIYLSNTIDNSTTLQLPTSLEYTYEPLEDVGDPLKNNLALRLQAHLESWELALYGYDGVAPLPILRPNVTGTIISISPHSVIQVDPKVTLQTQNYRQRTAGLSILHSFSSWQLKGVTAYTQPDEKVGALKNWGLESVIAAEKLFQPTATVSFVGVLQYASATRPDPLGNDLSSLSHFFDSNLMLGGRLSLWDTHTITFFSSLDLLLNSQLQDLEWEAHATEDFKYGFSITTIDGPSDSPLGVFSKNKSISAFIGYNF